jgi:hypothetical protein
MSGRMVITVHEDDADAQRLDDVTRALRRELLDLDVDDVKQARESQAPPGTRAVDVATVGVLLVAFKESVNVVGALVTLVRSWLGSAPAGRSVELIIGENSLKISSASREQQDRLIIEFVNAVNRSMTAPTASETG